METRLISQSAGIVSPEVVAKQLMKDALVSYMLDSTFTGHCKKQCSVIVPDLYCVMSIIFCFNV